MDIQKIIVVLVIVSMILSGVSIALVSMSAKDLENKIDNKISDLEDTLYMLTGELSVAEITSPAVKVGEEAIITASVTNSLGRSVSASLSLTVAGERVDTQSVTVSAGETKNVDFKVTKTQTGVFDIAIGDKTGKLYVAPKTLLIGTARGLTGKFATVSERTTETIKMWVEMVNSEETDPPLDIWSGGLYLEKYKQTVPVELIVYDDRSEPSRTADLFEKLITEDKVHLLYGPISSGCHVPLRAVLSKYEMPLMSGSTSAEAVREVPNDYIFAANPLAGWYAGAPMMFFEHLRETLPSDDPAYPRTIAGTYEETVNPIAMWEGVKQWCDEIGIEVVYEEGYSEDITDMTSIITKAKAANPDIYYNFGYFPEHVLWITQCAELGVDAKYYVGNTGVPYDEFWDTLGTKANGVITYESWHPDAPWPGAKELNDLFLARTGKRGDLEIALSWAACQNLAEGVRIAGTWEPEELVIAYGQIDQMTVVGPVKFITTPHDTMGVDFQVSGDTDPLPLMFTMQWQNGEKEIIYSHEVIEQYTETGDIFKTADPIMPHPGWD